MAHLNTMRLRVAGIEEIEITDPNKLCGKPRKKLDHRLLVKLKGQDFTATELKSMFGYGKTTALQDTQLKNLIEPVNKTLYRAKGFYAEKSTRWRIK